MNGHHAVTVSHYFLVERADLAFRGDVLITGSRAVYQFERVTVSAVKLRNEQAGTFFDFVAVIVRQNESNVANAEGVITRSVNRDQSAFCSFRHFVGNKAGYFRVARQYVIQIRGAEAEEAVQIPAGTCLSAATVSSFSNCLKSIAIV